jgi:prenyltransferase beta subunit
MNEEKIQRMIDMLREKILAARSDEGNWRGQLSSSAISTSVALFALHISGKEENLPYVRNAAGWLKLTMKPDGTWGDSLESPSNMTATLLTYASLYALGEAPEQTKKYLTDKFGGYSDSHIINGVLNYYGTDRTFSAPILMMCALAGVISDWEKTPQLPFELSVLPQRFFRFLQLPVVSYAIPALIAVGILRFRKGKRNLFSSLRESFIPKSLKVLIRLQPNDGGFLEAAPLTAFVALCLTGAGLGDHSVTEKAMAFLKATVRKDGSWPIDTDLSNWVMTLCVKALGDDLSDKQRMTEIIRRNASAVRHPYTGAQPGGWGWSDLSGSVPDGDDTSGALVALHTLCEGVYYDEVTNGIRWLMDLQNRDGGMPTFCKGWGKLPFDRSSADISAHAVLAMELWKDQLPEPLKRRCKESILNLLRWIVNAQSAEGSWTPLWFGDQNASDEKSPVYGTATVVDYLSVSENPAAKMVADKGVNYLLFAQNEDGGWGGAKGVASKATLTARALAALSSHLTEDDKALERGVDFLYERYITGRLLEKEPIGLYFSRLWYSEELYSPTFLLYALKRLIKSKELK